MSTICITGGHHNSALVVARELIRRGHKVVWIGHRHSARGDKQDSAEYIEVSSAGIPFHPLQAARAVADIRELIRFPIGIVTAYNLLNKIRPTAILSFGGYLGGTVALSAKLLSIPIFLHEQTVTAGRANKMIGRLAKKVYLTWRESAKYFDQKKIEVVGLPLRRSILNPQPKTIFTRRKPTLLVMGGKQGAHAINQFIFRHLSDLLRDYNIVHQTGTSSITHDYEHALSLQNILASLADCYQPRGYITENEIGGYLSSADLYLGRSGAHICYELCILGLRSILVPLMSTHDREQHKNATILVKAGLAQVLPQPQLSLPSLHEAVKQLAKLSGTPLPLPRNATQIIVESILAQLK